MRPAVLILSITTATFAATTVYFARELAAARTQTPVAASLTTGATTLPPPMAAAPPAPVPVQSPAGPQSAGNVVAGNVALPTRLSEADIKRMQADHSRQVVARLEEPQGREEMRAEHRIMFRNMYPGLDKFLGLSPEQLGQFMNLMADQQIGMQEKHARCMLDPDCSMQNLAYSGEDHAREIHDFLGADRAQKFESYKNTMGEREAVTQLRTRLADSSRLTEDTSERLIAALAEERAAMHREAAASGSGSFSFGVGAGTLFAPMEGSFESRYAAAQQNSQRLRDRAAQHLNAEQMRTFNEMQDELLVSLRGQLRQKGGTFSAVSVAMPVGVMGGDAVFVTERAEKADD